MDFIKKIEIIQKTSGKSQEDIARDVGVTFAALNRWVNKKSTPRKSSIQKINKLFEDITNQKSEVVDVLSSKLEIIKSKSKVNKNIVKYILKNPDIKDIIILSLTYNSNSIEGSTLSENETAAIIFHNKSFPSKSVIEHLEAKNHQTALEYIFNNFNTIKKIDENLILKLHSILMNGIHPEAGFYRRHGVRIVGSNVPTANYIKIPNLMFNLIKELNKKNVEVINHVSQVHSKFEQIHPFGDGNGRIGRLILNLMLLKNDIAPAIIKEKKKHNYYKALNKSQLKGDFLELNDFIIDSILEGYRVVERNFSSSNLN